MQEKLHLEGLNGLRAIAAVSVVFSHVRAAFPELVSPSRVLMNLADYAVTIFFTLSGFLITYLLFIEKKKTGVNIKNFYTRRILRIWPLYFAYLFIAIAIIYIQEPGRLPGSLPYYLFFAANIPSILGNHLPHLTQYWTLGVEEQFYLFWPWLVKRSRNVMKAIIIFTACFLALKLIFRFIYFESGDIFLLRILAVNRFECLSFGGIAAMLCLQKNTVFFKITTNKITQVAGWLSLLLMVLNLFHASPLLDNDLVSLITIILIVNLAFNENTLISLENRVFDLLGKISYGIYIIHPLLLLCCREFVLPLKITGIQKLWLIYPGVLLLTILFAWLSYQFLEKPFLRLKNKFSTVKTVDNMITKTVQ